MKALPLIIFSILILNLLLISAELFPSPEVEVGIGFGEGTGQTGVNINIPEQILNTSAINANSSVSTEVWITNIGDLDNVNSTQFDSDGGDTLNLKQSWLKTFGDTIWCSLFGCEITNLNVTESLNVQGDTEFTGNFTTECLHCEDGDNYFHGDGFFAGNVTAPNIEVMENLIVHGNSTCSGTATPCSGLDFFQCGWFNVNRAQYGCSWNLGSGGSCVGTATPCADVSTALCSNQAGCTLTIGSAVLIISGLGLTGSFDIDTNGSINASEGFFQNLTVYDTTTLRNFVFDENADFNNGNITGAKLRVNQLADGPSFGGGASTTGIFTYGFDDQDDEYLSMSVEEHGFGVIGGSVSIIYFSPGNALSVLFNAAGIGTQNNKGITFGATSADDYNIKHSGAGNGALVIGLNDDTAGTKQSRTLIIADITEVDAIFDFGHPDSPDPITYWQSSNAVLDEWVSITYNKSNAILNVSKGSLIVPTNITSSNVFIPQYVFSHTNRTISLDGANVWKNITFDQEDDSIKQGITHNFNDATNTTYTINEDGIYEINFNLDMEDTSLGASDIDVAGRVIYSNGTEILGSVFENDIIKQSVEFELVHTVLASFVSGDKLIFQFISDDEDVVLSTHASFGDHPDSVTIIIKKVANL